MTTIESIHNPRLKALRKLARKQARERSGLFAAEGEDLIAIAQATGRRVVEGFRAPGVEIGEDFHEVASETLAAASTLGSGTRAIGVYEQRWSAPTGPLCVYLHGVGDPGNVGAILRSALAFGGSCVALGPGCADPHSPKAVRASMGAVFAMALARVERINELPGQLLALAPGVGEPIATLVERACPGAISLLVGGEREGLPADVVAACEHRAHIPIATDSLNAAMAATVALYELTRDIARGVSWARSPAPAGASAEGDSVERGGPAALGGDAASNRVPTS
jgi:RNA methyltransferase, TrmH family